MRETLSTSFNPSPTITPATQPFAWQGWRLRVPRSWNAVRLEGDFRKGYALLADLDGPRLGVRWSFIPARDVTEQTLRQVIRDEAGDDAAKHAKPIPNPDPDLPKEATQSLLHLEPNPPGRDIFAWWSGASERLLELAYHTMVRDDVLRSEVIRRLGDVGFGEVRPVALFDLVCRVPFDLPLRSHRLNAGDLSLEFGDGRRFVVVRQVALAEMALRRNPLAQWLTEQQRARRPRYRATGEAAPIELTLRDGRAVSGFVGRARSRLRFFGGGCVTLAFHDPERDRLVFIESSDEALARDVGQTVGCDIDVSVPR